MSAQIFRDGAADRNYRARWYAGQTAIYAALLLWAFICLFPIYWTITTSFKMAPDVMKGNMIPWVDYHPAWLGWRSLGLSPETIGAESTVRAEFLKRFTNSAIAALSASFLACLLGSLAAYGLSRFSFKFGFMRNSDISFFFLSAADPAAGRPRAAVPGALQGAGAARHPDRADPAVHADRAADRDLDHARPVRLDPDRAGRGGPGRWPVDLGRLCHGDRCRSRCPGSSPSFILCLVLTWNEYFFAALLTSTYANTLPVMVASQTGSQGINWWSMAALSFAAILPLIVIGIALERYIIKGMAAGAVK